MTKKSEDICSHRREKEPICKIFIHNEAKKLGQLSPDERLDYYQDHRYENNVKKLIEKAIQKI